MKVMDRQSTYRNLVEKGNLVSFQVTVKETDLLVHAQSDLSEQVRESVIACRGQLESYIERYPAFVATLKPWKINGPAPPLVRVMCDAGGRAGVGPMAAVAGAIAEYVGNDLLAYTQEVIVENGGDIFFSRDDDMTVGIYAGQSPLSLKIGLKLNHDMSPVSICTSSGSIGHSLSLGKADAVCVVSRQGALADAAATSIGNRVSQKADIDRAIEFGRSIGGIEGVVVIYHDRIGLWGDLEVVPLDVKKG